MKRQRPAVAPISDEPIINTHDQLLAAQASGLKPALAITPFHVGHRTPYFGGWEIMRPMRGDKRAILARANDRCQNRFQTSSTVEPRLRKGAALDAAKAWVQDTESYLGEWTRNGMGDYVPTEIARKFPLRGKTRVPGVARVFWVNDVFLPIPKKHRASNGNTQVSALVRCANRATLARILNISISHLNRWHIVNEVCAEWKPELAAIATKQDAIYYNPDGATITGYVNQWFELRPQSAKRR